jgi:hypothetical protein
MIYFPNISNRNQIEEIFDTKFILKYLRDLIGLDYSSEKPTLICKDLGIA